MGAHTPTNVRTVSVWLTHPGGWKSVWTEGKRPHKTHHSCYKPCWWTVWSEHTHGDPLSPSFMCLHTHIFRQTLSRVEKRKLLFQRNNHNSTRSALGAVSASRQGPWSQTERLTHHSQSEASQSGPSRNSLLQTKVGQADINKACIYVSKASVSVRIESYSFIIYNKIHIWSDSGFIEMSARLNSTPKQSFSILLSLIFLCNTRVPWFMQNLKEEWKHRLT